MNTILNFFHLAGIIIALGSITVIDTLGFLARKSKEWTKTTIQAHYVTKPLIWIGTTLVFLTLIIKYILNPNEPFLLTKLILIIILILNGTFLSFYVSPRLTKIDKILPKPYKIK